MKLQNRTGFFVKETGGFPEYGKSGAAAPLFVICLPRE